ncbi:MAG: MBL fold metallo-hydrolase [Acidobacteria bacterium]|nr:MBL fold metallo-hydrolase [Acidobacteriota bacterium]MCA1642422.1 MBL fold metallo-hydrolase [Acidobacteriota bacterium]
MAHTRRGCGCALAVLLVVLAAASAAYFYFQRRTGPQLPPPSGAELSVHVLDVGQGDSILIIAPGGKTVLVDAGNPRNGKKILAALQRSNVDHIDLLIATHAHADHIGSADEVINGITVKNVLDSGVPNATKNYEDFLKAIEQKGVTYVAATPDQTFDLGGGARITVLAPVQPFFTKDQLRSGGNEPNANSVVTRLDYGDFSMLLTGDAEAQTEQRMIQKGARLEADVLKVGHHGSRYASSEDLLRVGKFKTAVISCGADNRYGHPSPEALDRLKAAGVKLFRTDLQGELTITTRGKSDDVQIRGEREAASQELWAGRAAQKDDSARSGFIQYGDFGPAPKPKDQSKKATNSK